MPLNELSVQELQSALKELSKSERRVRTAERQGVDVEERRELERATRSLGRLVASLQRNVLESYNPKFIDCRDLGHVWYPSEQYVEGDVLIRELDCNRGCGVSRHDQFDKFGEMVHRSYVHPEDYLLPSQVAGTIRWSKSFWRGITYMQVAKEG